MSRLALILFALAALLCVATALAIALLTSTEDLLSPSVPSAAQMGLGSEQAELPSRPIPPGVGSYPQTLERPLFFAQRRMPATIAPKSKPTTAKEPTAAPPPSIPLRNLVLHAVLIQQGGAKALIGITAQPPAWYAVGGTIGGWTVDGIDANRVTLRSGDRRPHLLLYRADADTIAN